MEDDITGTEKNRLIENKWVSCCKLLAQLNLYMCYNRNQLIPEQKSSSNHKLSLIITEIM